MALTFLSFLPALGNDFVDWDDPLYVTGTPLIRLNLHNLAVIFSDCTKLPLTRLSLSLTHYFWGVSPWGYILVNIVLHLVNAVLVFLLSRRLLHLAGIKADLPLSLIVAALFGVHPLHVESVVWVTERKDVLYAAFFLLSLLNYLAFLRDRKPAFYLASLGLFILSLLSKTQAVHLPLVLFAVDYLAGRKAFDRRALLEKFPFFLLALVAGLLALRHQGNVLGETPQLLGPEAGFPLLERIALAGYAFFQYLIKTIFPFPLSAIYPYPDKLPIYYWPLPLLAGILLGGVFWYLRQSRLVVFGALFFVLNLALTFQVFTQVTPSVMNDRYMYLASIGLFLIMGAAIQRWGFENNRQKWFLGGLMFYLLFLSVLTFERTRVWRDSFALWNDVIAKQERALPAWNNRGNQKAAGGDFSGAVLDFNRAVALAPANPVGWTNRGTAKIQQGDLRGALADLDRAVALNPPYAEAFLNRGGAHGRSGNLEQAAADFSRAVQLLPEDFRGYIGRGFVRLELGDYPAALSDFDRAIFLNEGIGKMFWGRGTARYALGDHQGGCRDFLSARELGWEPAGEDIQVKCQGVIP